MTPPLRTRGHRRSGACALALLLTGACQAESVLTPGWLSGAVG